MKLRTLTFAAILLCGLQAANALTVITTLETRDCKTWVKIQRHGSQALKLAEKNWLYGFISGYAMGKREDIVKTKTNPDSYRAWVTNYCSANPQQDSADAALALIGELKRKARQTAP